MDVGKLPNHLKISVLYLYALDQFLLCFIIQLVPNGPRIIMAKVLFAVLYLSYFKFLQLWSNPWLKYIWMFMLWFVNEIYVMPWMLYMNVFYCLTIPCNIQMFSAYLPSWHHFPYLVAQFEIRWHPTRLVPSKPKMQNGVESWLYYDQNNNDLLFEQLCN